MEIKCSFTEMGARERIFALLDSGREMLGPFERLKSPHLLKQGITPQNDDGMIIAKGTMDGLNVVIAAMEGKFQGGGIGEVSGAKLAAALENALRDNREGRRIYPLLVMDTGGVRLQEANYGLLAISEIQDLLVQIREYVPVVGVIPGKVGCFGGMSMTCGLFSYLIMTREGRLTLNGPEVIEQEAGIEEWDSSDKAFTYRTIGGARRAAQGFADQLTEDDLPQIRRRILDCFRKGIPVHRSTMTEKYAAQVSAAAPGAVEGAEEQNSRGKIWFRALSGSDGKEKKGPASILSKDIKIEGSECRLITVVPDKNTVYPRTLKGEVGLQQGWEIARLVREVIEEDREKVEKRPLIALVDVPSQAYGYREEDQGIFLSCAAAVNAYALARHCGHPVITFIVGNAISGAFLAHGLQGSYMLSLDDETITVHAMSKKSAARITKRSVEDMDHAAGSVAGIAYDIRSFYCLGAVNELLSFPDHDHPTAEDAAHVKERIAAGIKESLKNGNSLSYRLLTENGLVYRAASIEVRRKMQEEWEHEIQTS